jgi:hypothetical protein
MIKRISIVLLFFLIAGGVISMAQELTYEWLCPGTGLTYQVNTHEGDYQYIVSIKELYPGLSFRWDMTFPVRADGTVAISMEAMDIATTQRNSFSIFGGDLELEDETSVWVSKKVYRALKAQNPVSINSGSSDKNEILIYLTNTTYQTQLNDSVVQLPALYAETDAGNKYWILDNADNPIILKMTIQFNIQLTNIMTKEYLEKE